jgi:hypothetical protein
MGRPGKTPAFEQNKLLVLQQANWVTPPAVMQPSFGHGRW